jgi:hypothetical protein
MIPKSDTLQKGLKARLLSGGQDTTAIQEPDEVWEMEDEAK